MKRIDILEDKLITDQFSKMILGIDPYKYHGNFISIEKKLKNLKTKYVLCPIKSLIICIISKNLKSIILMNPYIMEKWIKRTEKYWWKYFYTRNKNGNYLAQTKFGEDILDALSYNNFQKKILKDFFYDIDQSRSCIYCNAQHTISYEREGKRASFFQIDHIFPQKKYPYFSISLFNLVPSCANCNLNKGSKDFWTDDYFHPYLESMSDSFKFTIGHQDKDSLYEHPNDITDFEKVKITITNKSNTKVRNHNELFDLEGIYNNFNDIAQEIIELGMLHPASKRKSYLDDLEGEKGNLFDEETLERIYLRVYPNPEDINKRPLSKFIQDIARFSDFYDDKL